MSTTKKPLITIGKPKTNAADLAAKNDGIAAAKPEQKRLNVNVDAQLHNRFKTGVSSKGQDMSKVVTSLLEQWLKDNE